ncbi:hypothetical protein E1B28_001840 [Marasmius oreades]|uniref:Hydrophobin n=1 Tax=Marasmius oreades TaxID=181124 RepID=A0A9P7S587_9AGAR|nr:uncharacterized protein E1B28_005512 [Marasmius oreades]XP_043016525.1 uncharacterized protein E1B28_001840 [Marasmius oreades]KAG7094693.1 hypothetical protein E1B28_005512 [Marasmius oreades]KAG7100055.1 hypothetical protein E1B28_001840 [Marasmius oreades]
MLFNKFFALSALTTLAAATAVPRNGGGGDSGTQCCQQVTQASDPAVAVILKSIGVVLQNLDVLVGLDCSPITVIGSNNGACADGSNTVNCDDNSHGTLISIGCVPVSV